ncbi:MAG: DUF2339 domain-containing protein [Bryobacteraceae bacterium]|nr:DUF2339 domain-containing protein [Bryobacteraceae bacterium]
MADILFIVVFGLACIIGTLQIFRLRRETADARQRALLLESSVASLTQRVWVLEHQVVTPPMSPAPAVGAATERPVADIPKEHLSAPPLRTAFDGIAEPVTEPPAEDWETQVGTNWLNRLGALVLVIGIALFLGYSITQLGPAGKIGVGAAVGVSLLIAGVALERQDLYRNYSFSLMGAGWAVVYFAAYASHGVKAARIIDNPALAVALLMAVSGGMIAHALRYRSETAASLAYLLGFVGLNVSPLTSFSVVASLILAVSLIAVAYKFDWFRLPLLGATLTYSTFVLRYDPSIYGKAGLLNGGWTLWIYWLTFEVYDILDVRRRGRHRGIEKTIFLLNATGFIGASLLHEWRMTAKDWSVWLGMASLAYLASTLIRARWAESAEDRPRVEEGGYEAGATISALLMSGALLERFTGTSVAIALLLEAELVLLAGVGLRSEYITNLGALLLLLPFLRLVLTDQFDSGKIRIAGLALRKWTPAGLMTATVLVFNRILLKRGWYFAAGAAILAGLMISAEVEVMWVAPTIAVAGVCLIASRLRDLLCVGAAALTFAFLRGMFVNLPMHVRWATSIVIASLYVAQMLWPERTSRIRFGLSVLGTILLTSFLYRESPERLVTVLWGIEGSLLLTAGFVLSERLLRLGGLSVFLLCLARLFIYDLSELDTMNRILSFVVLGVVLLAASFVYTRFRDKLNKLL